MKNIKGSRRDFIKKAVTGTAALSLGSVFPAFSAKSYSSILGANDRIKVGVMGVNGRGRALAKNFASQTNCEVNFISDVDARVMEKCIHVYRPAMPIWPQEHASDPVQQSLTHPCLYFPGFS